MKHKFFCLLLWAFLLPFFPLKAQNDPVVLAYFPSWSETWANSGQSSKLRDIPAYVNHVFLAFARPNMRYVSNSFDISNTGIQVPYNGCALKESISALKLKGIKVILSIGGETYWGSPNAYDIEYAQIKAFVDDFGFAGIDWDFEPNGSFATIGNATNVAHFKNFINNSRAIMPKSEGYIIACAPSGVGALGGQTNDDTNSPYAFANRNSLTGENDTNLYQGTVQTNGINLFGFTATGHMIPVIKDVGSKIDLIAFQGYNVGGSTNRSIMYDAYVHYANTYGFKVVAGIHYPNEPWGPYYTYNHNNTAGLSTHIKNKTGRAGSGDGIMIWQLLLTGSGSSAYSYLNVVSKVLNGTAEATAISQANNWSLQTYTGGASDCTLSLENIQNTKPVLYQANSTLFYDMNNTLKNALTFEIYNILGKKMISEKKFDSSGSINIKPLKAGAYIIKIIENEGSTHSVKMLFSNK